MSITRAQIARQLLNSIAPKGEKLAYINKKEAKLLKKMGGAGIDVNGTGIRSYFDPGVGPGSVSESLSEAAFGPSGPGPGSGGGSGDSGSGGNFATITRGPQGPTRSPTDGYNYSPSKIGTNFARTANFFLNPNPVTKYAADKAIKEQYEKDAKIASDVTGLLTSGYGQAIGSQYFGPVNQPMRDSYNKITGNVGPKGPTNDGGDNTFIPPIFRSAQLPSDIESRPSDFDLYAALEGREAMNFGMNPNNITGAMQRFSDGGEVRQRYGLGSFVKKIGRGVKKGIKGIKKFAKSDLGKAALLYAGGTYLGGMKAFGGSGFGAKGVGKFGFKNFGGRLLSPTGGDGFSNIFNPLRSGGDSPKLPFVQTEEQQSAELAKKIGLIENSQLSNAGKEKLKDSLITKSLGIGGSETPALVKYGIPAAMAASYLFTKNEEPDNLDEEMMKNYKDTSGLKEQIASYPEFRFQVPEQYRLANGGRIGYDMGGDVEMASYGYDDAMNETRELFMQYKKSGIVPMEMEFEEFLELLQGSKQKEEPNRVMAQEGGIMNLGGLEKDYRDGGFVPIGEYEKKDDVPARLSKNEFVFTADAVRAAGGGSVDKGADLMYKTMKNLESRVG